MTTIYEDKLDELGLKENQLSSQLRKKINEFKKLMRDVEELRENAESDELDEDELEEAKSNLEEALTTLDELDESLAKEIHVYNRRRQNYKFKKEGKEEPKVEEPKVEEPKVEEQKVEETKNADGGVVEQTQETKEKKSNTPFLLGVLLVALTGGLAYKFLKK
jgi:Sec-independent protein translocase protein TatA